MSQKNEEIELNSNDTDSGAEGASQLRSNNSRSSIDPIDHRSLNEPRPSGTGNGNNIIECSSVEKNISYTKPTNTWYNRQWRLGLSANQDACKSSRRCRTFMPSERKTILNYLIKNDVVGASKGLLVWKHMIEDGLLTDRTPQSLLNHFKQRILPNIEQFGLEKEKLALFLAVKNNVRPRRKQN